MNPDDYGVLFNVLRRSSNECESIVSRVRAALPPGADGTGALLDIGAGDGSITQALMPHFSSTVAVEARSEFRRYLECVGIEVGGQWWENYDAGSRRFDAVLASHVFYYFPRESWVAEARRMLSLLKPRGRLFVVMTARGGPGGDFIGRYLEAVHEGRVLSYTSSDLRQALAEAGIEHQHSGFGVDFRFVSLGHFLNLCQFLFDANFTAVASVEGELRRIYEALPTRPERPRERVLTVPMELVTVSRSD